VQLAPEGTSVATVVGAIVQVPPKVASVSVTVCPTHTVLGPTIGDVEELTVTVIVAEQPAEPPNVLV
jgi:hypothetical protein